MMDNLFIDTNVMIDFIAERELYYQDIAKIITLADQQQLKITASSLSFVNTFYVLSKQHPKKMLTDILIKFRVMCDVSGVDEISIDKSLISKFTDFEDAVQYYSALHHKCNIFITRNKKDFRQSEIPVMTPKEYLVSINKK